MHKNLAISSLIAFILLFFTCPLFTQDVYGVVDANNQFAFELYSRYKSNEGNIFFSPYSISSALAMTYEGARGRTADEMQSVFHFPKDEVSRREGFFKIYSKINKKDKEYQLNTANALWAQKNYPFLPEYFKLIENYYGGKVTNLDFSGDAENSRLAINSWVSEKTNNKITDLIPPEFLSSEIRLVLTNAVYFKGFWLEQFDKNDTAEKDFRVRPGNTVKARMMCLTGKEFQYTETEELQILELPYKLKKS